MRIADLLAPEFDQELAVTRRVLERVPDGKGEWKPHAKSFSLGHLAQLVARLPGWATMTMRRSELDLASDYAPYSYETTATLLAEFDRNAAEGKAAIAEATNEDFQMPWSLKMGERTILTQPRYSVLRSMTINHLVHHRAQLGVYLRLLDVPVPGMYGPTADERSF
jgi:uncharacterized damage-inducible protein DinB